MGSGVHLLVLWPSKRLGGNDGQDGNNGCRLLSEWRTKADSQAVGPVLEDTGV